MFTVDIMLFVMLIFWHFLFFFVIAKIWQRKPQIIVVPVHQEERHTDIHPTISV